MACAILTVLAASSASASATLERGSRALLHAGHAPDSGAQNSTALCGVSSLGYQCYRQVCGSLQLHWSLGGPPPGPGCAYAVAAAGDVVGGGAVDVGATTIHIALVSDLVGYVSMSLPERLGWMAPADAIIALMGSDGGAAPSVKAYLLKTHHDIAVDDTVALSDTAVLMGRAGGMVACFSTLLAPPDYTADMMGDGKMGGDGAMMGKRALSTGHLAALNFATSSSTKIGNHRMDNNHLCSTTISLIALSAVGGEWGGAAESMGGMGGVPETSALRAVYAHGALMMLAWLVLLPAGILAARHRWLFPPPQKASTSPDMWFVMHRACQVSGALAAAVALVLAFTSFGHGDEQLPPISAWGAAEWHGVVGITVAIATGLQLLGAVLRPSLNHVWRPWFNAQHHWMGRGLLLAAIVNIALGITALHSAWEQPVVGWAVCAIVLTVGIVAAFAWAEVKRSARAGPHSWANGSDAMLNIELKFHGSGTPTPNVTPRSPEQPPPERRALISYADR